MNIPTQEQVKAIMQENLSASSSIMPLPNPAMKSFNVGRAIVAFRCGDAVQVREFDHE